MSRHWPEFAQAGKERVTVRQLLSHQAGLVAQREPQPTEAIFDWARICELLDGVRILSPGIVEYGPTAGAGSAVPRATGRSS